MPSSCAVIETLGAPLNVILNKDALMILPCGVDKATGLAAAVAELNLSLRRTVWQLATPRTMRSYWQPAATGWRWPMRALALKAAADWVTQAKAGQGVIELIDRLLADNRAEGERVS